MFKFIYQIKVKTAIDIFYILLVHCADSLCSYGVILILLKQPSSQFPLTAVLFMMRSMGSICLLQVLDLFVFHVTEEKIGTFILGACGLRAHLCLVGP